MERQKLSSSNGMEYTYSLAEKDKTFTIGRANIKLLSLTCNTTFEDHTDGSKTINGHKFVNLGLTSGTLWAETNVGASESQAFGNSPSSLLRAERKEAREIPMGAIMNGEQESIVYTGLAMYIPTTINTPTAPASTIRMTRLPNWASIHS